MPRELVGRSQRSCKGIYGAIAIAKKLSQLSEVGFNSHAHTIIRKNLIIYIYIYILELLAYWVAGAVHHESTVRTFSTQRAR